MCCVADVITFYFWSFFALLPPEQPEKSKLKNKNRNKKKKPGDIII